MKKSDQKGYDFFNRKKLPPVMFKDNRSETVPDETMSLRTILNRFTRGIPIPSGRTVLYDEDDSYGRPDFESMDYAEREAWVESALAERREISSRVEKRKKEKVFSDVKKVLESEQKEAAPSDVVKDGA